MLRTTPPKALRRSEAPLRPLRSWASSANNSTNARLARTVPALAPILRSGDQRYTLPLQDRMRSSARGVDKETPGIPSGVPSRSPTEGSAYGDAS
jgi:hypothetical protein